MCNSAFFSLAPKKMKSFWMVRLGGEGEQEMGEIPEKVKVPGPV